MHDSDIMRRNVERINKDDVQAFRVSAEHYLWLAREIENLQKRNSELVQSLPGMLDA